MSESASAAVPEFASAAEFKQALGKALLRVARTDAVRTTSTASVMSMLGLPAPVATDAGEDDYTIPEISPEEIINGIPRSDLKASYLRRHDHKKLYDARAYAYQTLRNRIGHELTAEAAERVCAEVGLPVPTARTSVSVYVLNGGEHYFTVDGKISDEQVSVIERQFDGLVNDPGGDIIRGMFPDAKSLPDRVTVRKTENKTWPPFPAYTEPEDETGASA